MSTRKPKQARFSVAIENTFRVNDLIVVYEKEKHREQQIKEEQEEVKREEETPENTIPVQEKEITEAAMGQDPDISSSIAKEDKGKERLRTEESRRTVYRGGYYTDTTLPCYTVCQKRYVNPLF